MVVVNCTDDDWDAPPPGDKLRRTMAPSAHHLLSPLAIVVSLCSSPDRNPAATAFDLRLAMHLGESLDRLVGSRAEKVLLVSGVDVSSPALARSLSHFDRVVSVERSTLALGVRTKRDRRRFWPLNNATFLRPDGVCSTLKLHAWNLTQYAAVLVQGTDLCLLEDPLPWMRTMLAKDGYFYAPLETRRSVPARAHDGLSDRLIFTRPDALVFQVLKDNAKTGDNMPFANSVADVLETALPVHLPHEEMPRHLHTDKLRDLLGGYCP